jgi:hypothetical protein
MQRASRLIRGLNLPGDPINAEELVCAAWKHAVGRKVADHTRAARMVRSRLIVEVEDKTWQRQLFTLTPQILASLARHLGTGVVDDLEFRIVPPRRGPARAEESSSRIADEAESISDPVLRVIYKASRKKASA